MRTLRTEEFVKGKGVEKKPKMKGPIYKTITCQRGGVCSWWWGGGTRT